MDDITKRLREIHHARRNSTPLAHLIPTCAEAADEIDRLRAELARLTTLRPASECDGTSPVLWSTRDTEGKLLPYDVTRYPISGAVGWTPLPPVKEADK